MEAWRRCALQTGRIACDERRTASKLGANPHGGKHPAAGTDRLRTDGFRYQDRAEHQQHENHGDPQTGQFLDGLEIKVKIGDRFEGQDEKADFLTLHDHKGGHAFRDRRPEQNNRQRATAGERHQGLPDPARQVAGDPQINPSIL